MEKKDLLKTTLLACLLLISNVARAIDPGTYQQQQTIGSTTFYFNLENDGSGGQQAVIVGIEDATNTNCVIPKTLSNYRVAYITNASMSKLEKGAFAAHLSFEAGCTAVMAPNCFEEFRLLSGIDLTNYAYNSIPTNCFKHAGADVPEGITLTLNNKITIIENAAFNGSGVANYDFANTKLEEIQKLAFEGCTKLTSFTAPATLTRLGATAFQYCYAVDNVDLSAANIINIPSKCFFYCTNLNKITFSPNLKNVETSAFQNCQKLRYIEFPPTLTIINATAFFGAGLEKVVFKGTTPPTIMQTAFQRGNNATFYVPVDCSNAYVTKLNSTSPYPFCGLSNEKKVTDYIREQVKISDIGYKSYYLDTENFKVPANTIAYVITGVTSSNGMRQATLQTYNADMVIPKQTGFVLEAVTKGSEQIFDYAAAVSTPTETPISGNSMMKGTAATSQLYTGENGIYYVLSTNSEGKNIGFYYQKGTKGEKMTLQAHQAGLFIPTGTSFSKEFIAKFGGFSDETAGIDTINDRQEKAKTVVYDLQGRKVNHPTKGIYIVNGKKVVVK